MPPINTGAGYSLDIDVSFSPPINLTVSQINRFSGSIRSFREPLNRAIKEVVGPSIRRNFDEGGRPPWEPLKESTVLIKSRLGIGDPEAPLIRSGVLRRVAGQLNAWSVSSTEATFTQLKGAEYGAFHITGTKDMPSRDFMVIQPEDQDQIMQIFDDWLVDRALKAGFLTTAAFVP